MAITTHLGEDFEQNYIFRSLLRNIELSFDMVVHEKKLKIEIDERFLIQQLSNVTNIDKFDTIEVHFRGAKLVLHPQFQEKTTREFKGLE